MSDQSDHLIETFEDGVATLTMNRPAARNALSGSMMAAMTEAIPRLGQDPKVRAVVLTGQAMLSARVVTSKVSPHPRARRTSAANGRGSRLVCRDCVSRRC